MIREWYGVMSCFQLDMISDLQFQPHPMRRSLSFLNPLSRASASAAPVKMRTPIEAIWLWSYQWQSPSIIEKLLSVEVTNLSIVGGDIIGTKHSHTTATTVWQANQPTYNPPCKTHKNKAFPSKGTFSLSGASRIWSGEAQFWFLFLSCDLQSTSL